VEKNSSRSKFLFKTCQFFPSLCAWRRTQARRDREAGLPSLSKSQTEGEAKSLQIEGVAGSSLMPASGDSLCGFVVHPLAPVAFQEVVIIFAPLKKPPTRASFSSRSAPLGRPETEANHEQHHESNADLRDCLTAYVGGDTGAAGRRVTACMDSSPNSPVPGARLSATRIFAAIGVTLEWHGSNRCPSGALSISLKETTPPELDPGAFAYALPYEGTHIVVFLVRIQQGRAPQQTALVLGYVIAHEITHMLEGVCRHSDTGLMKAKWTDADFREMRLGRLDFAAADIKLIYIGLARRNPDRA
jgi:hypothetical protein